MTLREKKRFLIDLIEESTSEDLISQLYYDATRDDTWDNTEKGKALIMQLLEKSQQEAKEGKTISHEEMLNKIKKRFDLRKTV